jgi:cold shock CspA family protein
MSAPREERRRHMRGAMLWFNEAEEFGFISTEDGERLLVRGGDFVDGIPEGRCGGLPVSFQVTEDEEGRRAEEVRLVEETVPRRARSRHRGR